MRGAVDYAERAEECRRLAKLCKRPEEWGHFLDGRDLGDAAQASTGEIALENNSSRRPVSKRTVSFRHCAENDDEK